MFTPQPFVNDLAGRTRAVIVTPAAGADFVIRVPDGYLWDFLSLAARLVTDANVANRTPTFTFDDGANRVWSIAPAGVQAAGATVDYQIGEGLARDATVAAQSFLPAPTDLRMFAGYGVTVATANRQVGDLWVVTLTVCEFQTNAPTGPRAGVRRAGGQNRFPTLYRRPGRAY